MACVVLAKGPLTISLRLEEQQYVYLKKGCMYTNHEPIIDTTTMLFYKYQAAILPPQKETFCEPESFRFTRELFKSWSNSSQKECAPVAYCKKQHIQRDRGKQVIKQM
jgi:hypothetical protein